MNQEARQVVELLRSVSDRLRELSRGGAAAAPSDQQRLAEIAQEVEELASSFEGLIVAGRVSDLSPRGD